MRRLDRFIFAAEDARRLAAVRFGLCGLLAFRLAHGNYASVAGQPRALFQPSSYMRLFSQMPGHGPTVALWSVAALLRRRRPRSSGPQRGTAYGWPIHTAMAVVALAYFFVGFQKLRYSGVQWFASDNLRWVLYASSDRQADPNGLALFVADRAWLAHLLAAGTMATEISFPFCFVFPRLRWFFIPAVISMHVGIRLAMGLDYSAWWITVLVVFVNWPVVVEWLQRPRWAALPSPLRRAPG